MVKPETQCQSSGHAHKLPHMVQDFLSIHVIDSVGKNRTALRKPQAHSQQENEGRQLEGMSAPEQCSSSRATTCRIPRVPVHTSGLSSAPVPWAGLRWTEQRVSSYPPLAADGALQGAPSTAWERSQSPGRAAGGGYQSPKELKDHGILHPSGQFLSHAH